jgi:ribonuclease BN (tRNA processing enzyme)
MELQFLGSGDAFGSGGRYNTCFYVSHSQGAFLLDCGASSLVAFRKFEADPNKVRAILITHLHGDHFGGLPFFLLDAQLVSGRTAPLTIAGPPGLRERLATAMEVLFPGSTEMHRQFAISIRELEPEARHNVEGIEVTPYLVKHPSGAPPFAYRIEVDGKILCYSGDTEWTHTLSQAAKAADLFISECYSFDRRVKFHLDYATLAQHLPALGAKRVILTHMSQDMLAHLEEIECETARDGMVVSI